MGRVGRLKRTLAPERPELIDLGMGRGRDLIYFARRGYRVLGVDLSSDAIGRARRRAKRLGTSIRTVVADLTIFRFPRSFDIVYSNCVLHHLPSPIRAERFEHFKEHTTPGGVHAVNAFVLDSRRRVAPDAEANEYPFQSGELESYYTDWERLESRQADYDCVAGGRLHRHRVELVVARKPVPGGSSGGSRPPRETGELRRASISGSPGRGQAGTTGRLRKATRFDANRRSPF